MKKIKKLILDNKLFCIIFIMSILLHIIAIVTLGFDYNINSDDVRYIESGINLFKNGTLTLYGTHTAQIMPGLSLFIASIYGIVKSQSILIIVLKLFYFCFSLLSLLYLYKTIKLFSNKNIAALSSMLLLTLDFVWMDNVILTETPFILFLILLIYNTFKLTIENNSKNYIMIIISYIICLFLRPIIAPYPIFLFIYLLLKKYSLKKLIKGISLMVGITLLCLIPWWIRNYKLYNDFIPFTIGASDPIYWGTYQGYNFPQDYELDYNEVPQVEITNNEDHMANYYYFKQEEYKSEYRLSKWWEKDKVSLLVSYLIYKPGFILISSFYWQPILGIPKKVNVIIHGLDLLLCLISAIIILVKKKNRSELFLLSSLYLYLLYSAAMGLAFSRYAMSTYFLRFIIIGIGFGLLKNKKKKI